MCGEQKDWVFQASALTADVLGNKKGEARELRLSCLSWCLSYFVIGTRRSRPDICLGSSNLRMARIVGDMSRSEPSERRR